MLGLKKYPSSCSVPTTACRLDLALVIEINMCTILSEILQRVVTVNNSNRKGTNISLCYMYIHINILFSCFHMQTICGYELTAWTRITDHLAFPPYKWNLVDTYVTTSLSLSHWARTAHTPVENAVFILLMRPSAVQLQQLKWRPDL